MISVTLPALTRFQVALAFAIAACIASPSPAMPQGPESVGPDGNWEELLYDYPVDQIAKPLFDPLRNRLLLFGARTWELPLSDPLEWRVIPDPTGPGPGGGSTSLYDYDSIHDRFVIVVPRTYPAPMDVYALSLAGPMTWSRFTTTGSPALNWTPGGFTFSPNSQSGMIMGGTSAGVYGGTITVDWARRITLGDTTAVFTSVSTSLGERAGFAMATDQARSRVVLYGGSNASTSFHDVRTAPIGGGGFALATTTGGPPGASGGYATVDTARDRMLLFYNAGGAPQLWQLTLTGSMTWSQVPLPEPGPDWVGGVVYDAVGDRVVSPKSTRNGLWSLSLDSPGAWTDYSRLYPDLYGTGQVVVLDTDSHRMVYLGRDPVEDAWALSLDEPFLWNPLEPGGTPPTARTLECSVYDAARARMIIFGGRSSSSSPPNDELWALSLGETPAWSPIAPAGTPPAARYYATAIYDPIGDRMLVWGGNGVSGTPLNDLWQLTLSGTPTWSPLTPAGPLPPYVSRPHSVYDSARHRMVLVGGLGGGGTWALSLDGTPAWTELPPSDADFAPVYDSNADRIVALRFGGGLRELSLADPVAWEVLAPTGAPPTLFSSPVQIFDPQGNRAFFVPYSSKSTTFVLSFGDVVGVEPRTTSGIELAAGVPNPARVSSRVRLALPSAQDVSLDVLDVSGRRIRTLVAGRLDAGVHTLGWGLRDANGGRVAPGVYVYALKAGEERLARRFVVVR